MISSNKAIEKSFSLARIHLKQLEIKLRSRGFRRESGEVADMFERMEFLEAYFNHENC